MKTEKILKGFDNIISADYDFVKFLSAKDLGDYLKTLYKEKISANITNCYIWNITGGSYGCNWFEEDGTIRQKK